MLSPCPENAQTSGTALIPLNGSRIPPMNGLLRECRDTQTQTGADDASRPSSDVICFAVGAVDWVVGTVHNWKPPPGMGGARKRNALASGEKDGAPARGR